MSANRPKADPDLIRDVVLAELERTGVTRYGLWLAVGKTAIPRSTLMDWLAGKRNLPSKYTSQVLTAVNITLTPPADSPRA